MHLRKWLSNAQVCTANTISILQKHASVKNKKVSWNYISISEYWLTEIFSPKVQTLSVYGTFSFIHAIFSTTVHDRFSIDALFIYILVIQLDSNFSLGSWFVKKPWPVFTGAFVLVFNSKFRINMSSYTKHCWRCTLVVIPIYQFLNSTIGLTRYDIQTRRQGSPKCRMNLRLVNC